MSETLKGRIGRHGFTMVESLVAVAILSVTAIMGSRTLLTSTRAIQHMIKVNRSSALTEMIFQQYASYANKNYQTLNAYDNPVPVQPKDFFNSADNMGYDGFLVTTAANYSTNLSTCGVVVTLSWQENGQPRTVSQTKIFSQSSSVPLGGSIQVFVKSLCNGPGSLSASCPGYQGFTISAPAMNGGSITGSTDSHGMFLLTGVLMGNAITVQITAPAPSNWNVASTDPAFHQAYFTMDTTGSPTLTLSSAALSSPTSLTKMYVTDFQPAGGIVGTAYDSSDPAFPVIPGAQVVLRSGWAALNNSFQSCGNAFAFAATADSTGHYSLNNIVHADPVVLSLTGPTGSAPDVPPGPGFAWGYTQPTPITFSGLQFASYGSIVQQDAAFVKRGYMTAHVINPSGLPLPLASVMMFFPSFPQEYFCTTDAKGNCSLYNVLSNDTPSGSIDAGLPPQGGGDLGTFGPMTWQCPASPCIGNDNIVNVPTYAGYMLKASVTDLNPVPMIVNADGHQTTQAFWLYNYVQPDGSLSLPGFFPSISTQDPTQPFVAKLIFDNETAQVSVPISVVATDQATSFGAPRAQIEFRSTAAGGFPVDVPYKLDGTGQFAGTVVLPLEIEQDITTVCDAGTHNCGFCLAGQSCGDPNGPPVTVPVDTRNTSVNLDILTGLTQGYVCTPVVAYRQTGQSSTQVTTTCNLLSYSVQGVVTDGSTLLPLAGVSVFDGAGTLIGITADGTGSAPLGFYSGWAAVQTPGANGNTRSVTVSTVGQTSSGTTYSGVQNVFAIPTDSMVDPTVPLNGNLAMPSSNLASGGM